MSEATSGISRLDGWDYYTQVPLALPIHPPSLPGLTRQSIHLAKSFVRRRWMRGSSPRMTGYAISLIRGYANDWRG
jgi:hypothetical protein